MPGEKAVTFPRPELESTFSMRTAASSEK